MNKLVRNFIGYKVKLCKLNSNIMNKNKIKDKDCFKGNMDKKQNFDMLINEIRDVNKSLKHWLQEDDFVNTEDMLPKVLNLKTISVKGSNFFSDCELSDLVTFDNRLTSELMSVSFEKDVLRIHDLKTGQTPAKMEQLEIYAALFCLEYKKDPTSIFIELRIYQYGEVFVYNPEPQRILEVMNIIRAHNQILTNYIQEITL